MNDKPESGGPVPDIDPLIRSSARSIVAMLRSREVSPLELLDALERRIAAVDPEINALPTLCLERARDRARAVMERPVHARGILAGLPVAIKDLTPVAGVRTTYGSEIFHGFVPEFSDVLVETLEARGAVVYAKSNTPEFGAGAQTFNPVFGPTRNPWDTRLTPAGSSGGAAAALATGMAWLAQGSDMGGSLRNPASFCSIVGLRPSPGRVARGPTPDPYMTISVEGPMARTVADLALMLDAMCGFHPRDPISLPAPADAFEAAALARRLPRRIAFSRDLGVTPVDAEVAALCERAAHAFSEHGVSVEEAAPDFSGVHEVFHVLRALSFVTGLGPLLDEHGAKMKPEVVWNIEKGLALSAEEIATAHCHRAELYRRVAAFFEDYELLLSPATIVPPYPVEERYVERCGDHVFDNYVDWLAIAYAISVVSLPALSLPCGFTAAGLPVGLQIVGRPRGEADLLSAAQVLEDVLRVTPTTPIDPVTPG